jgi:hypothetical protein
MRNEFDDLPAFLDRKGHRDGAHNMLTGLQRGDRHPPVVRQRRVDVHQIDLLVGKQIIVSFVASIDPEGVSHRVQRSPRSPADRVHVSLWMAYVDRDELDAKPKTNDCDIDPASAAAHDLTSATFWRQSAEERL